MLNAPRPVRCAIAAAKRFTELPAIEVRPALLASGVLSQQAADELLDSSEYARAVQEDPAAYYAPGHLAQVAVALK